MRELEALLDISRATQLAEDEPALARVLAEKLARASDSEACIVSRLDVGSTMLQTLGVHGISGVAPSYDVYAYPLTPRVLRDGVPELAQADAPGGDPAEMLLRTQSGARALPAVALPRGVRFVPPPPGGRPPPEGVAPRGDGPAGVDALANPLAELAR